MHDWSGFQSGLCQFFYVGTRLVSHSFHCCYVWLIWRATPDSWRSHKARQRQKRCDELMKRAKVNEKWEISKHWREAAGSLLWSLMSRSQFYNAFYEAHPNCRSHVHTSHWCCCCWGARSMLEAASPINTCDGAAWPRALLSLVFTNSALVTWLSCTLFLFPLPCGLWRKHCTRVSPHVFSSSCLRSHDNGPWAKHCFTSNGCLWWDTENRKMKEKTHNKVGDDGGWTTGILMTRRPLTSDGLMVWWCALTWLFVYFKTALSSANEIRKVKAAEDTTQEGGSCSLSRESRHAILSQAQLGCMSLFPSST